MGEIELMGRRRLSVTSHPSCDFHMRNGITPIIPRSKAQGNPPWYVAGTPVVRD